MYKYTFLPLSVFFVLIFNTRLCNAQITNPRPWAEWEETDGIIIHQPNFYLQENPSPVEWLIAEEWDSLYVDLVRGLIEEGVDIYYIIDTNDRPEYHSGILDTMNVKYGIDINDPGFHVVIGCKANYSSLTKWTRDHGPMNVYKNGVDTLYFYLFRDDYKGAGGVIRDYQGIPDTIFFNASSGNISSDGGNYIVDGDSMGIINGGLGAVLPDLKEYFGLDTVYSMPDYLDHADYYMKMLNEETLVISSQIRENYIYGSEPYTYEQDSSILAGMMAFFQEQVLSRYGRPMKVYQVPNPPSVRDDSLQLWWYTHYASYTNSLIVNRSLFVPQFSIPSSDSIALEIYREAMPGYKIIPVFSRRGATGGGGVHCLTNSVAAAEPVLISHACLSDTVDLAPGYEIVARIRTRSGVNHANVMWSANSEGPFQPVEMQNTSGDLYSGTITRPDGASEIYYYIFAGSNSGRTGIKPMVAPDYTYHFSIKGGAPGWIPATKKAEGIVKVYPNPATHLIKIDLSNAPSLIEHALRIDLYDYPGRNVLSQLARPGDSPIELNVSYLTPGNYFLVVMNDKGDFYFEKIIIVSR